MTTFVDLDRKFRPETEEGPTQYLHSRRPVSWEAVVKNSVSLIVADANAGKTIELKQRVLDLRGKGEHACFVQMRELVRINNVEDALEFEELEALKNAKKAPESTALYIFVDSIDEAIIGSEVDLQGALARLARFLGETRNRAVWVLSARPAIANAKVINAINNALRCPSIQRFSMVPLSRTEAAEYLKRKHHIPDAQRLLDQAEQRRLDWLIHSPGKLNLLVDLKLDGARNSALADLFEQCISDHLRRASDEWRDSAETDTESLRRAANRLACAATLSGKINIELPNDTDPRDRSALDAERIAGDLRRKGIRYLLSSGLFEDSLGSLQVKIQPIEIQHYLSAKHLSTLIRDTGDAERVLSLLSWRYDAGGDCGVYRGLESVAGWLATLNERFCEVLLDFDPQCVLFFGDRRAMPEKLAVQALLRGINAMAEDGADRVKGWQITSEYFSSVGSTGTGDSVPHLLEEHWDSEVVRSVILQIASVPGQRHALDVFLEKIDGCFDQILSNSIYLKFVLTTGTESHELIQNIRKTACSASKLLTDSVNELFHFGGQLNWTASEIVDLIRKCTDPCDYLPKLESTLFLVVYPNATPSLLQQLGDIMHQELMGYLETYNAGFADTGSKDLADFWFGCLKMLIADWVKRPLTNLELDVAMDVLVRFQCETRYWFSPFYSNEVSCLQRLFRESDDSYLRKLFVCKMAESLKGDAEGLYHHLISGELVTVEEAEARRYGLNELADEIASRPASGLLSAPMPRLASATMKAEEGFKDFAQVNISSISDGTNIVAFRLFADQMLRFLRKDLGSCDMDSFRTAYGEEVAAAFIEGFPKFWRVAACKWSDVKLVDRAARLMGLQLELSLEGAVSRLRAAHAVRALRWGLDEQNNLPVWFWPVVEGHPKFALRFVRRLLAAYPKAPRYSGYVSKLISSLPAASQAMQSALAEPIWNLACNGHFGTSELLSGALAWLGRTDDIAPELCISIARERISGSVPKGIAGIWVAFLMMKSPRDLLVELKGIKSVSGSQHDSVIKEAIQHLSYRNRRISRAIEIHGQHIVGLLSYLFVETSRIFDPKDDTPRRPFGIHDISDRDAGEWLRDSLPKHLESIHEPAAYLALRDLSDTVTNESSRHALRGLARNVAEEIEKRQGLTEGAFISFEGSLQVDLDSQIAFARAVEHDLHEIKDLIERGDFSPRRFLSGQFEGLTAAQYKAMEDEFQLFLAGMLNVYGRRRYSVVREEQLHDATRRDISVLCGDWKVSLELKVTEGGWSLQAYRESLRDQLVGCYMKDHNTSVGFFIVLLQKDRTWKSKGETGVESIDFEHLLQVLRADALQLETEKNVRLKVIGIDARESKSARRRSVRARILPIPDTVLRSCE